MTMRWCCKGSRPFSAGFSAGSGWSARRWMPTRRRSLKGTSGLDLCRKLVERDPAAKVVLLSAYDDEQYLFQAMRVGAKGYLLKQITGEELVRHLERVADGETAIDASLAGRAVTSAARLQGGEFWPGAG